MDIRSKPILGDTTMNTFMDTQKNALLRKFHALLRKAGVNNEEKMVMLASYGVQSSKDMSVYELTELCHKLDMRTNKSAAEANKWRKRVMAAIGGYLRAMGQDGNANMIIAIACRASRYSDFNSIPVDQLRSVYNAFKNRTKAIETVDTLNIEMPMGATMHWTAPIGQA